MVEDTGSGNFQSSSSDQGGSVGDYLRLAANACDAGDTVLGMHLYLTAFERAAKGSYVPSDEAVEGLKRAWTLSCSLGERALAEYIFDKLEPFLTPDEVKSCADELQRLALDKLEEFGLSRDDLEDMAELVSRDFMGLGSGSPAGIRMMAAPVVPRDAAAGERASREGRADAQREQAPAQKADDADDAEAPEISFARTEHITFKDLVGYNDAVRTMMSFGIGVGDDPEFQELVKKLNARHGLERMPAADTLLLRAPAREDANRFALATMGELDLPSVRLKVEEGFGGMPVLCVMAQSEAQLHIGSPSTVFEGRGVLVLEDVDLWGAPPEEQDVPEGFGGFVSAHLSRGAREAVNLIRSAVDNPDVYVIATASTEFDIHPFFCELLEPFTMVDIGYPTPEERVDIWMDIAHRHPSLRGVDRAALVRLSAQLPRYDIYLAVREALEEAYKDGLALRRYVPVTSENLFEKLAAFQPLDSQEYRELEGAVIRDFRRDIDLIESMLGEMEE